MLILEEAYSSHECVNCIFLLYILNIILDTGNKWGTFIDSKKNDRISQMKEQTHRCKTWLTLSLQFFVSTYSVWPEYKSNDSLYFLTLCNDYKYHHYRNHHIQLKPYSQP